MKRPSFQFYPADWRNNANLGRCSFAARGAWLDVMAVLHDSDEYGLVRWPLKELANSAKVPMNLMRELVEKSVLKGADKGEGVDPFVYVPRSGRKDGEPVTLVPTQTGPLWFSSRMVKDEYVRSIRGDGTRFGDEGGPSPKGAPKATPKDAPKPPIGDGASSSSSPSGEEISLLSQASARPEDDALPEAAKLKLVKGPPPCPHLAVLALWREVLPALPQHEVDQWRGSRSDHLRARWRETAISKRWRAVEDGLTYFRRLFGYVGQSRFLTGKVTPPPGRKLFTITLGWLVKPENWAKTIEGDYHQDAA